MFTRFVFAIISATLLAGCAGPVVVGFGPSQANPNSSGLLIFEKPRPQRTPYFCDNSKGVLVFKKDGEPMCRLHKRSVDAEGNVTETLEEVSPDMVGQNGSFQSGGGSPQGIFPYGMKTDCPQFPIGGGLARCS